jgi:hypothetical protein
MDEEPRHSVPSRSDEEQDGEGLEAHGLLGQSQDQRNQVVGERRTTAPTVRLGPLARHQPVVSFNFVDFYRNERTLMGVNTLDLSIDRAARSWMRCARASSPARCARRSCGRSPWTTRSPRTRRCGREPAGRCCV